MSKELYKAVVKATGKNVEVYKHLTTGDFVDYEDCGTMYKYLSVKEHQREIEIIDIVSGWED